MRKLLLLCLSFALSTVLWAQDKTVSGRVTSADGEGLPGVNVLVQGTTQGTTTDVDGNYTLNVPSDATSLVYSFVGYSSQVIVIGNRSVIDAQLEEDIAALEEVIVTAFGLEKEKKAVTYAAQNVETTELTEARPLALADGLTGKVAGLSIARSGGGVGADPKVILRGNRSIAGSSEPIYVVDGVTIGGNINDISPDDIEDITVLKGANAAALYGSRANNGVIVITTKSGKGAGKGFNIDFNTSYMGASPIYLIDWQNEYGQGSGGIYQPNSNQSWGSRIDGSQVQHWSNDPNWGEPTYQYVANPDNKTKDFYQTGHNIATNIGVSARGETTNSYISYTYTDAKGNIPGNKLDRHNVSARVTSTFFNRLTIDAKINAIREFTDNQPATGEGYLNPVRALNKMPPNIRTADAQQYSFINNDGLLRQHYWTPNNNEPHNVYWTINNTENDILMDRTIGMLSLGYDITDNLNFRVRSSIDRQSSFGEQRRYNDTYIVADNGYYEKNDQRWSEWNTDAFLNYKNEFFDGDWSLDATIGGNIRRNEYSRTTVFPTRDGLNVPNLFAIGNFAVKDASEAFSKKEVQSLFGFATIGWKNAIFLDLTARNDWSSTLPEANWSYFYPSVGLTAVISDLVAMPDWWTFLKVRGNWAQVGNDTDPYQIVRTANVSGGGSGGFLQLSTQVPAADLRPEETTSTELGVDVRFFENRLGLDFTWYKSNSTDQLFAQQIPTPSGASSVFINGADIQNQGIELALTATPIRSGDFSWDLYFNYGANESEVVELAEGLTQLRVGGADFMRQFQLIVGREWGEVYSRGFGRDDQGRVIVDDLGLPTVTPGLSVPVANFNPDWLGGFGNTFRYKNLSLSFLIDHRQGGTVVSFTNAIMFADGVLQETVEGRESGYVFGQDVFPGETAVLADGSPNTLTTNPEALWARLGGRNAPAGEAFVLDATNTRLRELVLGYELPNPNLFGLPFTHIRVSLIGRNLFFFNNAAGNVDPEIFQNTATNADGLESFSPPTVREFGVNLKFGF
jgi:TonB-linked SusC/RagA family outer membrane protein